MAEPEPSLLLVLGNSTGGIGSHVATLAAACVQAGYRVTVCGPPKTEKVFRFATTGADFVALPIRLRLLGSASARRALRDQLSSHDVVHAHGLQAGVVVALLAGRRPPPRVVVSWHNAPLSSGPRRGLHILLEWLTARRADVVIGVSDDLVVRARRARAADVRLVPVAPAPLPAAVEDVATLRESLVLGDSAVVLAVGRLHPQKRLDVLVSAALIWSERVSPPIVLIAGEGPERARLQASITEAAVDVRLLGRRDDVADLMSIADVVVLPSAWEGWPLAAMETLSAGRALVATAVGGVPSMVGPAAILVPVGKPEALASAVARLLDDPVARHNLEREALARAAQWPDAHQVAERLMAVYADPARP